MTETTAFPAARTAVLTGAASERGIGRATADRLAREGWNIAILDIDGEAAARAAKEIGDKHGVQALGLQTDVSDEASIDAAVSRVEAELPPIVALANIAGISSPRPFMEETKEGWERVFAINMTGTFLVTQRVLGGMIDRKLGRVASISSIFLPGSIGTTLAGGLYSATCSSPDSTQVIFDRSTPYSDCSTPRAQTPVVTV